MSQPYDSTPITSARKPADKGLRKSFDDWAWNKKGDPIGSMLPHIAAREAFAASAEYAEQELASLRAQLASARKALEGAEEWLSGWASAEPYISKIRAALKEISK